MQLPNRRTILLGGASLLTASAVPAYAGRKKDEEIDPLVARVVKVGKDVPANHIYVYPDE